MKELVIFCKSYHTDLNRTLRLIKSINEFNLDEIPVYISVPEADLTLFNDKLKDSGVHLITDESIIKSCLKIEFSEYQKMTPSKSQQVVKSEFWRLGLCANYLCIDSDSFFIRPFKVADFLHPNGTPYSVMDEAKDLLDLSLQFNKNRVAVNLNQEADLFRSIFMREGKSYYFGPSPWIWSRKVWQSLDENYLQPRKMNFLDAINTAPIESRWYGEALLTFKAIPLIPCQALFKVYHYAWQYDAAKKSGITNSRLASHYLGIIYQSSWERELDYPKEGGNLFSVWGRRMRRFLGRI